MAIAQKRDEQARGCQNGRGDEMNDFKTGNVQTTLGELITALSEETRPFLRNERETSIVVGYIFNDLLSRSGSRSPGGRSQRRSGERTRSDGTQGKRN